MVQNRSHAVMAQRHEPADSLDFFPTPPWATRALCECVLPRLGVEIPLGAVHEPACGEGHMALTLAEYAHIVFGSDIHDYGFGAGGCDFTAPLSDFDRDRGFDWVITNPPFNAAGEFAKTGLALARCGVALLVRTSWLEGGGRWREIFSKTPPTAIAQFSERVPMVKGRWDPDASTATSYCWCVWIVGATVETRFLWIPPGQRTRLTRPDDIARFAEASL